MGQQARGVLSRLPRAAASGEPIWGDSPLEPVAPSDAALGRSALEADHGVHHHTQPLFSESLSSSLTAFLPPQLAALRADQAVPPQRWSDDQFLGGPYVASSSSSAPSPTKVPLPRHVDTGHTAGAAGMPSLRASAPLLTESTTAAGLPALSADIGVALGTGERRGLMCDGSCGAQGAAGLSAEAWSRAEPVAQISAEALPRAEPVAQTPPCCAQHPSGCLQHPPHGAAQAPSPSMPSWRTEEHIFDTSSPEGGCVRTASPCIDRSRVPMVPATGDVRARSPPRLRVEGSPASSCHRHRAATRQPPCSAPLLMEGGATSASMAQQATATGAAGPVSGPFYEAYLAREEAKPQQTTSARLAAAKPTTGLAPRRRRHSSATNSKAVQVGFDAPLQRSLSSSSLSGRSPGGRARGVRCRR